jgi:hypothetical protein
MSKLGERLLALAIGTGATAAMALAFSGPAMASDNTTARPTSNHTATHQVPVRHLPEGKPPAHHPQGHKPVHRKPVCKVHCPKPKTTVVKKSTKVVSSVVLRGHQKFIKKVTYSVKLVRHTYYTQTGRKCVKHTNSTVHRKVVSVRYVPVHRPVVVKPPAHSAHPVVWHKPAKPAVHHPAPRHECKPPVKPVVHKAVHKICKPAVKHPRGHHKCAHKGSSKPHKPSHGAPAASQQA